MAKRKIQNYQLIEDDDLTGIQTYREEVDSYIIQELLEYDSVFTGTNFQAFEQGTPDMTVKITAGVGMINGEYSELLADGSVTINAAGAVSRTDLITVTSALTDDTAEAKVFINPTTEIAYTDTVALKERYIPTFHYYPGTSVVPTGEVGICTIVVAPGVTEIYDADITDIRPEKPTSDVNSHRLSNPIDHANGSIFNVAIASTAAIGTEKIQGISTDTLSHLIELGMSLNAVTDIVYDAGGLPLTITTTGDGSTVTTLTYDGDDNIETVSMESATHISLSTVTWTSDLPSNITTVVTAKP